MSTVRKLLLPAAAFMLLAFSACKKEEIEKPASTFAPVNFQQLIPGQKTVYRGYTSSCENLDGDFRWTGDNLVLEVVSINDSLYFKEYFTPESPSAQWQFESTYPVIKENDYLLIPDRSNTQLFFFYANDTLFLDPVHDTELVQDGCELIQDGTPFIGNDIGKVEEFKFGMVDLKDRSAVSCVPMVLGIDGYLIYNGEELSASHTLSQDFWWGDGTHVSGFVKR